MFSSGRGTGSIQSRNGEREIGDSLAMEFNDFPGTGPDALPAVRAAVLNDGNLRFHQLNGVFRTHADTTTAEVALTGNDVDH